MWLKNSTHGTSTHAGHAYSRGWTDLASRKNSPQRHRFTERKRNAGFQIPVGTRPRVACVRRLRHLDPSLVLLRLSDPPTLDFDPRDARARRPHARRRTSLLDVEKGIATEGQRVGEETSGRLAHHPGFADSPPPETGFQNLQGTHDSAARPLCLGASVVQFRSGVQHRPRPPACGPPVSLAVPLGAPCGEGSRSPFRYQHPVIPCAAP